MKIKALLFGLVISMTSPALLPMLRAAEALPAQARGQAYDPIFKSELTLDLPYLLSLSVIDKDARKLNSGDEAEKLFAATQETLKAPLEVDPKNGPAPVYRDVLSLMQYYMSHAQPSGSTARIKILADMLEKSASAFAETCKVPAQQVSAAFYSKFAKFVRTDGTDGISEMIPLKDKLTGNKELLSNIDLLVGYSLALSPATAAQGLTTMNKVAGDLSVYGRVAIKLTEALQDYGLDAEGAVVSAIKPGADAKLTYSVQLARGMPAGVQFLVMNTSAFIWEKANASNRTARVPAFLKDGFPGVVPVDVLRERDALLELNAQNYKAASAAYKKISEGYARGEMMAAIDSRLWDIEVLGYQKSGQLADLEATYTMLRAKYANQGRKGFNQALAESYRKTLDGALDASLNPKAQRAQQQMTIQFVTRFFKTEGDRTVLYPIKAKLALLYRSMKMYNETVDTYLDIAKDQPLKNYLLAADAQSQLANWPAQPDFASKSREKNPERQKLLSIYETVSQLKKDTDWTVLAHIGLLNRALGQYKTAEILWLKSFKTDLSSRVAQDAGGLLLHDFRDSKRNDDLIDLVHLFASKKVSPSDKGVAINYKPWLADALYNGGQAELGKGSFPKAIKYLEEFSIVFPTEPRFASAGHTLAIAYKSAGKLIPALNVCKNVGEKYPQYPLRAKMILAAGDWAAATSPTVEYAFYFYGKYINDYKNEANVPQVRGGLAELYFKRKLYGWASRLYREQSTSPKVPKDMQLKAAVRAMDIEDQFGDQKEGFVSAQRILELASPNDPARNHALAFEGRYMANQKDLKGMNDLEQKMVAQVKASKEVLEAVAFIRYRRGELLQRPIVNNENNLQIRDPEASVRKYYARFEEERKNYLPVCQVGVSTYCAPSLMKMNMISKQAIEAMDKIQIAETLGPARVNSFKVFKQLQISKVQQSRKENMTQAMALVKSGTTTPAWRDEITKSLEIDEGLAH